MRVSEITKFLPKSAAKRPLKKRRVQGIKGPYAPPPKALPQPKPLNPTPSQIRDAEDSKIQSYARFIQKNLTPIKNVPPVKTLNSLSTNPESSPDLNRSAREMEVFLKQIRGESPRKPL